MRVINISEDRLRTNYGWGTHQRERMRMNLPGVRGQAWIFISLLSVTSESTLFPPDPCTTTSLSQHLKLR